MSAIDSGKDQVAAAGWAIAAAAAVFSSLARHPTAQEAVVAARGTHFSPALFSPEPGERLGYVAMIVIVGAFALVQRFLGSATVRACALWLLGTAAVVKFSFLRRWYLDEDQTLFLAALVYSASFGIVALLQHPNLRLGPRWRWLNGTDKQEHYLLLLLGLALSVALPMCQLWDERSYELRTSGLEHHFSAFGGPVFEVAAGKTLLVNLRSMYGLYPHFYALVLPTISIRSISILSFALSVVAYAALFWGLRAAFGARRGLFLFVAYLGFHMAGSALWGLEPYFQYMPTRSLFPMLTLAGMCAGWRRLVLLAFAFCSVAWNLETGIVCVAALAAYEWQRMTVSGASWMARAKSAAQPIFAAALGLVTVSVALFMRSGQWPDWGAFGATAALFYGRGFMMIPLNPIPRLWTFVCAIYLVGLWIGVGAAFKSSKPNDRDQDRARNLDDLLLPVSVLGLGLFSYYQGRSAESNLPPCAYPVFVVGAIVLPRLATWLGDRSVHQPWSSPSRHLMTLLTVPVITVFGDADLVADRFKTGVQTLLVSPNPVDGGGASTGLAARRAVLRELAAREAPVLSISYLSWFDHQVLGTRSPLRTASYQDAMLAEDDVELESVIRSQRYRFIVVGLDLLDGSSDRYVGWMRAMQDSGYQQIGVHRPADLVLFRLSTGLARSAPAPAQ